VALVVFAPDAFKGSLSSADAARALALGWADVRPEDTCVTRPMADGGEGTIDAFALAHPDAIRMPVTVPGPDDRPVDTAWLLLPATEADPGGVGVVELAATSGIALLDALRPDFAHTEGLGHAIAAALDAGVSRLVVGLGSSASTDGGLGVLRALGARAQDADGAPVARGLAGLRTLASLDLTTMRACPRGGVQALTDVANPLCGPSGAAAVFGPQKGLRDAASVRSADDALARLAALVGRGGAEVPGAGAAGGTGFALLAWGADLVPGADTVAALAGLPTALDTADLVVTGEGRYDRQSLDGKVPGCVRALAVARGCRVLLAAGAIADDVDTEPFDEAVSLVALAGDREAALAEPARWLRAAGRDLARRQPD
jgi:glycerate kinase